MGKQKKTAPICQQKSVLAFTIASGIAMCSHGGHFRMVNSRSLVASLVARNQPGPCRYPAICAKTMFLNNAHSHKAWARNIANAWLPRTNIWETLQRCESKIQLNIFLELAYSACSYKSYTTSQSSKHYLDLFFPTFLNFFFKWNHKEKSCPPLA